MPSSQDYYDYEDEKCKHGGRYNGAYCPDCHKKKKLWETAFDKASSRGRTLFLEEELKKVGYYNA